MLILIVLMAAVSVSVARPGYASGAYGSYGILPQPGYASGAYGSDGILPQPVQDTHEVAAAKAAHFAAHAKARAATAHAVPVSYGGAAFSQGHGVPSIGHGYGYSTVNVHSSGYGTHGANSFPGGGDHGYHHVVLTAHGVPVDTPEVQAAKAANAAAHIAAKHQHLHG